ncbi:MAG: HD domain-containing protein [Fusobacteriaceae bacterium]
MNNLIISRIMQGLTFLFGRYKNEWNLDINAFLNKNEFAIFQNMERYDKIHSYKIYKKVKCNKILKNNILFYKLALLHDCGKENCSIFRRIKKVLIGDKKLENHSIEGFEKLKNINIELAHLICQHHDKTENIEMLEFQRLDSE